MDKVTHGPVGPGLEQPATGQQGSPGAAKGWASAWLGRLPAACLLAPVLAAGVGGSALAALVTHTPDTASAVQVALAEGQGDAERPLADLLPPGLLVPKAIDLLLDMHVDAVNLAYTPMQAAASAVMTGGLDVRTLNPHVPANPMFPGYGLSYEPPPADGAGRQAAAVQAVAAAAAGPGAHSAAVAGQAEAAEAWQDSPRDRLAEVRDWIADRRMELLVGLGVAVVLGAAVVASRSRTAAASSGSGSRSRSRSSAEGSSRRGSRGSSSGSRSTSTSTSSADARSTR